MNGINTIIKKHLGNKFVSSVDYRDKIKSRGGYARFKMYKLNHTGVSHSGVYFLYNKNELVYIGYTTNIYKRVTNHMNGDFDWTKVKYIDIGNDLNARKLEFALLVTNKTKYNSPKYVERRVIKEPYNYWWTQRGRLSEIVKYSDKRLKPHYQKMLDMSFEEFEKQHKLKMSGEPHDLVVI